MTKKILIIPFCFLVATQAVTFPIQAVAGTSSAATSSAAGTSSAEPSVKAQELLDRVATKVAELTDKLRRTYSGKVTSVGTTSYVVTTTVGGDKTVTTNDVTTFFRIRSGNHTEVNFANIKAKDEITAIGTVDPATGEMTAREIIAKIRRINIVGKIVSVDKTVITLQPSDGPQTNLDLADAVSLRKLDQSGKITTAKISDFAADRFAFIIAYQTGTNSQLTVLRVDVLSQ